jgi:hypothetical protein
MIAESCMVAGSCSCLKSILSWLDAVCVPLAVSVVNRKKIPKSENVVTACHQFLFL